jgi:hypothetical protein
MQSYPTHFLKPAGKKKKKKKKKKGKAVRYHDPLAQSV